MVVSPCFRQIFQAIADSCSMPRRPLMVRAALQRRSCDGVAATELRRPAPSRSFCASRGADAYATELMLRAALHCDGAATETLLRRSCCCDGVAAATELRRPAPSRSFCASLSRPRALSFHFGFSWVWSLSFHLLFPPPLLFLHALAFIF